MIETLRRNILSATVVSGMNSATTVAYPKGLGNYRHIALSLIADSVTAGFTVKIKASRQSEAPDFTTAVSPTNSWFYVQTVNNDAGNFVAGSTGYTIAADGDTDIELNQDVILWLAIEISSYTDGNLTVLLTAVNNN